jgi:ESF2/ABP1 family protein
MATRKRNEFLDLAGSDGEESDRGYDSEAIEESKGRSSKRRRVLDDDDDDEDHTEDEDGADNDDTNEHADSRFHLDDDDKDDLSSTSKQTTKTQEKSSQKPIKKKKKDKTGVIYFSSLPPYLKPFSLKTLLLQRGFGPINRVFLTPAVASTSGAGSRRSNKRKMYSDGWVEFESKKVAKVCAETLNATTVGGRSWYRDDVWNMKYLRGFRWADLMEQVQIERSQREAQRRIEDTRSRKEDKVFLSGVEKGKVIEGIRKKREDKAKANDTIPEDIQIRRVFRQNEVKLKEDSKPLNNKMDEDAKRVLGKIF